MVVVMTTGWPLIANALEVAVVQTLASVRHSAILSDNGSSFNGCLGFCLYDLGGDYLPSLPLVPPSVEPIGQRREQT